MNIVPASKNSFTAAVRLLQTCGLPTADVNPGTQLFVVEEQNDVVATVAVEYDWNDALLRSLSVSPDKRSKGYGGGLINFIENYVKQQGVQTIYLLTTTAAPFFARHGYRETSRNGVPGFVANAAEFQALCPSNAVIMKKVLA